MLEQHQLLSDTQAKALSTMGFVVLGMHSVSRLAEAQERANVGASSMLICVSRNVAVLEDCYTVAAVCHPHGAYTWSSDGWGGSVAEAFGAWYAEKFVDTVASQGGHCASLFPSPHECGVEIHRLCIDFFCDEATVMAHGVSSEALCSMPLEALEVVARMCAADEDIALIYTLTLAWRKHFIREA